MFVCVIGKMSIKNFNMFVNGKVFLLVEMVMLAYEIQENCEMKRAA